MAFTEAEKLKIARITGVSAGTLATQIRYLGTEVTAAVEAAVREELDRWDLAGSKFTRIVPNERNAGVGINPDEEKADIRRNIRQLLYLTDAYGAYGGGQTRLVRS